jgi:hypothetical protein
MVRLFALCLVTAAPDGFQEIVDAVGDVSHDVSCATMERWIAGHEDSDEVPHALLWMARLRLLDGRDDLARPLIERAQAQAGDGRWRYPVLKELASIDAGARRYGVALDELDLLAASDDDYWRSIAATARVEVRAARAAWWAMTLLLGVLAAACGARLIAARGRGAKVWPPPFEVIAALPVTLVLAVAASRHAGAEGRALFEVLLGGLVLLWVTGVALQERGLSRTRRMLEMLFAGVELAGLFFCVLVANGLLSKAVDTLIIAFVQ